MATTQTLLVSIADTIKDYRQGEIPQPTPTHVAKWVNQFDASQQSAILNEMDVLLKKTYFNKATMEGFLSNLVSNAKLVGANPAQFWHSVNFLDIQDGGSSQHEMLMMFSQIMKSKLGIRLDQCGSKGGLYVYLDDMSFTGNRVLNDLNKWIRDDAPSKAAVHVIVGAFHSGGQWYADKGIQETAVKEKKSISLAWWRMMELEDRVNSNNTSDVFRPSSLPTDATMTSYVNGLAYPPPLRDAGHMGQCKVFADEQGRHLLEQQFLTAGLRVRAMCPNLPATHRLLGYASTNSRKTLGFGSTLVTFRNCPNNCPLAFWAGDPWYPLFPRKNNIKKFARSAAIDRDSIPF